MPCRARGVAAALFLLSGALAPAGAAPRQVGSPPIRSASRAAATQPSAASFWRHLTNLWGKTGGSLDPFGNPTPGGQGTSGTTTDHADTGGSLDPFGVK